VARREERGKRVGGQRAGRIHRTAVTGWAAIAVAAILAAGCTAESSEASSATSEVAASGAVTVAAVEESASMLDDLVADVMERTGIPGVAVGVVAEDQVVLTEGWGVRERGKPDTVDADTVFQLASLSKPLSSTVVSGLVGQGALDWDTPVSEIEADFALSDPYVTDNVTVEDFYAHRSGLPGNAGNDLEVLGFDQATILDRLRFLPLDPFRATYHYSNFGMTTGGVAAATAAGTTLPDAADQLLFEPAGMGSSSFRYADFVAKGNRASLHAKVGDGFAPNFVRQPDAQAPAGGASSNVEDLGTWMRLQLADGALGGEQLIDADALARAHTAHMNTALGSDPLPSPERKPGLYGLGFNVGTDDFGHGNVVWGHSGAFTHGAGTTVRLIPELGLGVVVLTNAAPVGAAEAIADGYIDRLLNGPSERDWTATWTERFAPLLQVPPIPEPADPTPAGAADDYVGTYRNDYFGEVRVEARGDTLVMLAGPGLVNAYDLEHYDADTFLWIDSPEVEGYKAPLEFEVAPSGSAAALVLGEAATAESWNTLQRAR
jgi:CubicO group peptidase (beta-lactamase class C family)